MLRQGVLRVTDIHPDIARTAQMVGELVGDHGLLARAWGADTNTLTARQPSSTGGNGGGGHQKPGSRPPARLDLWSHVQTTLDEARTLCADELGTYLANDRAEEALRRLPALLEATLLDCADCLRCQHGTRKGLCARNCADGETGEVLAHDCACRHRIVARRVGQLHSTLRTALGLQQPRIDPRGWTCPACGAERMSVRGIGCGAGRMGVTMCGWVNGSALAC
jgi:hypothetical protein